MIAIPDAGEIKAKVVVEYDGSGVEQAKKDLASLADAAGSVGEGTGSASEGLNALNEQASKSTGSVQGLSSAFEDLPKIAEKSGSAFSTFGESVAQSQGAIAGMTSSVEEIQAPLEKTGSLLEKTAAPMTVISEHAQSMSDNFAQIGDSLTQSAPLLSQYADSMQNVVESTLAPNPMHLAENMAVFQDALANPYPFQMMQQHLNETGQTWGEFTSSIGEDNTAMLHEMATTSGQTHEILGGMSANVQAAGKTFHESASGVNEFTQQFNGLNEAAATSNKTMSSVASNINAFGGVGSSLYGPEIGLGKSISFGEAFSNSLGGVMGALNDIAMPIMAVQMIGMAVGQVGKGIYDMAAVAEGAGAHGIGTFTGTVDALGQSLQGVGQQFSEGIGKSLIPTLQAMNYQVSQAQGEGGIGGALGSGASFLLNLARFASGTDVTGGAEGLINQFDAATGQPLQFQGPAPAKTQSIQIAQQLAQATATMQAQANDPVYLAAQAFLGSQEQKAQIAQQSYDVSHYTGSTGPNDPRNAIIQYELAHANGVTGMTNPDPAARFTGPGSGTDMYYPSLFGSDPIPVGNGPPGSAFFGGVGGFLSNMFSGGASPTSMLSGLLGGAAFGGLFSGLFGGGDIAGGGAAFSNRLGGGANIQTALGGSGTGDQQVSLSHTFTANITWEAQNLNKSFTAIASWAEQGVQHAVTAVANWAEQNVIHPVLAVAQWAEQGVQHAVTAVANWAEEGIQHAVTAIANWSEEGVQHEVIATAQWIEKDLEHLFTGKASWIGEGLEHTFSAVANWTAQNLTPSFTVNPSVSMFAEGTSNFSGGPAIVGEAGPEVVGANGQYSLFNQGASLVNLPSGASVYPMKDLNTSSPAQFANGTGGDTTPISLNMGGSSAPQSFNISLHVNDQAILSAFGVPLVQNVRLYSGQRGY